MRTSKITFIVDAGVDDGGHIVEALDVHLEHLGGRVLDILGQVGEHGRELMRVQIEHGDEDGLRSLAYLEALGLARERHYLANGRLEVVVAGATAATHVLHVDRLHEADDVLEVVEHGELDLEVGELCAILLDELHEHGELGVEVEGLARRLEAHAQLVLYGVEALGAELGQQAREQRVEPLAQLALVAAHEVVERVEQHGEHLDVLVVKEAREQLAQALDLGAAKGATRLQHVLERLQAVLALRPLGAREQRDRLVDVLGDARTPNGRRERAIRADARRLRGLVAVRLPAASVASLLLLQKKNKIRKCNQS